MLKESDADGMRRVSLASCDSEHFSELFVYIHEHCDVTSRDGELPVVPCTGVGSLLYNKQLEEGLNVTYVDLLSILTSNNNHSMLISKLLMAQDYYFIQKCIVACNGIAESRLSRIKKQISD